MSKRSRARIALTCDTYRGERVIVPTEPLLGTLKPLPMRMMSPSDERCRPWLLVRIRTSWPRSAQVLVQEADVLVDAPGSG